MMRAKIWIGLIVLIFLFFVRNFFDSNGVSQLNFLLPRRFMRYK
jgi:hypothetical protein